MKKRSKKWIPVIAGTMCWLLGTFASASDEYIFPNSETKQLDQFDTYGMTNQKMSYGRNEIYARHGMKFESQELTEYFNATDWYEGTIEQADFDESVLSDVEKANVDFLLQSEKALSPDGYLLDYPGYDIHAVIWWETEGSGEGETDAFSYGEIQSMLLGEVKELGNEFSLDLDGDGTEEQVLMEMSGYVKKDGGIGDCYANAELKINGESVLSVHGEMLLDTLYGVSLDEKKIDLILYDNGADENPTATFYSYQDQSLKDVGSVPSYIKNLSVRDGLLYGSIRTKTLQAEQMRVSWVHADDHFELLEEEAYKIDPFAEDPQYYLNQDLWVMDARGSQEYYLMTPGSVTITYTDGDDYILLLYDYEIPEDAEIDGGWLYIGDLDTKQQKELFDELFFTE